MKNLIFTALMFFGLVSTSSASPTATKEFDLESNFCKVVSSVIKNPDELSPAEIIEREQVKNGFAYKNGKGLIGYRIRRHKVFTRGEELWFKSYMVINKNSMVIVNVLDSKSEKFQRSIMQIEIHKNGTGTKVKYSLWVDAEDVSPFFLRLGCRVELFKMEKSLRNLVGEPLPERE